MADDGRYKVLDVESKLTVKMATGEFLVFPSVDKGIVDVDGTLRLYKGEKLLLIASHPNWFYAGDSEIVKDPGLGGKEKS